MHNPSAATDEGVAPSLPPRPLVLSVDVEEWFTCRWASGSRKAMWPDTATLLRDVYGSDRPGGGLTEPMHWILDTFDELGVKATFFVLGEGARWYPELVRETARRGHEIASHGMHHGDMSDLSREEFRRCLAEAKELLEDLAEAPVVGFRAASFVVEPFLADVLEELGFAYDSSVCPARSFSGKYKGMLTCPQHPYRIGARVQSVDGDRPLWEIPVPTMPLVRLPACGGIQTRVFGLWWSRFALWYWSRYGSVVYYFHPYEVATEPVPVRLSPYVKLFMRRCGKRMRTLVPRVLRPYRDRAVRAVDLVRSLVAGRESRVPNAELPKRGRSDLD